jgi:hypothetical protein
MFYYALVAHGSTPLADFSAFEGNFKQFAIQMLEQIDSTQEYTRSDIGGHIFFALAEPSRMVFLCLCDAKSIEFHRRGFLDELRSKWHARYGSTGQKMKAYEKVNDFGPEIKRIVGIFNTDRSIKLAQSRENNQRTQDATTRNLTLALARGEQLEIMAVKADQIKESASTFHREGSSLARMMWCQKARWYILAVILLLVIAFVITWVVCGIPKFQKCFGKK